MARVLFVTVLVLVAACTVMATFAPPTKRCCENEVWKECGNACQEAKCGRNNPLVKCTTVCEPRCECVKGCCRNKVGKCVRTKDC